MNSLLDYDDVTIALSEHHVDVMREDVDVCDTSFSVGNSNFLFPIIVSYDTRHHLQSCEEINAVCKALSVATIGNHHGALVANVDLEQDDYTNTVQDFVYVENNNVTRKKFLDKMRHARKQGKFVIAGCSLSSKHCAALTTKSAADAIVVGSLAKRPYRLFKDIGLNLSRVTLLEEFSNAAKDAPIFAVVENSSQACKALVAGADAVVVHFEGLPNTPNEARILVNGVVRNIAAAVSELCELAQVKHYKHLKYHCRLVPRTHTR